MAKLPTATVNNQKLISVLRIADGRLQSDERRSGMLAASCLGIFVIPGLYVAFEKMRRAVPEMLRKPFGRAGRPGNRPG